jgi:diguanylate cyclase (GGDEF)-like protein
VPFAGIAGLAFASVGLHTSGTLWWLVGLGAAVALTVAAVAVVVPWRRLPPVALLAFPLACDVLIGMLRHSQGGTNSGYGILALLPVLWVGLTLPRWAVVVTSAATGLLFALPILIVGAPMYPSHGWRGVVLSTVVSLIVGLATSLTVAEQRRQAGFAGARARELDRLVATQSAIATADYDPGAVMRTIASEALKLTDAFGATIALPEDGRLVIRAAAGRGEEHLGFGLSMEATLVGEAFRTGRLLVCRDTETDPYADRDAARQMGARSCVVVPLPGDEGAAGVLEVYSSSVDAFGEADTRALSALAGLIGVALVRADLVHKLGELASIDELTGLANRRAWYRGLDEALARTSRSGRPLSVVVLDLDGLKEINDRNGHQAGDKLLVEVARRWASALRPTDLLGRIGGDEFAVLLEGADAAAAAAVIARLEQSLVSWHRASAGAAMWDGAEDGPSLVTRADADMYRQKRAHRLQLRRHEDATAPVRPV